MAASAAAARSWKAENQFACFLTTPTYLTTAKGHYHVFSSPFVV